MRWTKIASAGVVGLGLVCGTFEALRPTAGPSRGASLPPSGGIHVRPVAPGRAPAPPAVLVGVSPAAEIEPTRPAAARPALPVEPVPGAVATWRRGVFAQDPSERAAAVDAIPSCPEHDGVGVLEGLMSTDPDPMVRERAVMAYTQATGRRGVAALRKVALADEDENVGSAARASLMLIDRVDPLPPRGSVSIACDESAFSEGAWLTVRARFQADQDVPDARFVLSVPKGWEVDSQGNAWTGKLWEGRPQEALFRVRASREVARAKLTGRLKLDFAEELDVEVLTAVLPLSLEGGEGRLLAEASGGVEAARVQTIALTDEVAGE